MYIQFDINVFLFWFEYTYLIQQELNKTNNGQDVDSVTYYIVNRKKPQIKKDVPKRKPQKYNI